MPAERSTSDPSWPFSPSALTNSPSTPKSSSPVSPSPIIPDVAQRPFLYRPQNSVLTTSEGVTTSCTSDESLYAIVKVHTAKCTECDKRNMDTMRRCPDCTFQVCKPCYERREKDGRGLMHGNSVSTAMTPTTQRKVRRRPVSAIGTQNTGNVEKAKERELKVQDMSKKKKRSPPSDLDTFGRHRPIQKKNVPDSVTEESSSVSSDDNLSTNSEPLTPSKRRRTTITSSSNTPERTSPTEHFPTTSRSEVSDSAMSSPGEKLEDLGVDKLMQMFGVNTPENPYHEHLLSRREPVVSNPVIKIPEVVKRGFRPRPSSDEIRKRIQDNTLKHLEAQRKEAEERAYSHTVRAFVEDRAAEHRDDVLFDRDENEAVFHAMKETARKWCNQVHGLLSPDVQRMVRRSLDMRLDLINGSYKAELAKLIQDCANEKIKELTDDKIDPQHHSA